MSEVALRPCFGEIWCFGGHLRRSSPIFADLRRTPYGFQTSKKTCRHGPVAAPLCGNLRTASPLDISDISRDPDRAGLVERGGVSQRHFGEDRRRSAKARRRFPLKTGSPRSESTARAPTPVSARINGGSRSAYFRYVVPPPGPRAQLQIEKTSFGTRRRSAKVGEDRRRLHPKKNEIGAEKICFELQRIT